MAQIKSSFLNNFNLQGKTALISASSTGLGYAMAMAMARSGATVILNGRQESRLQSLTEAAQSKGLDVNYLCADLSDFEVIDHTITEIKQRYANKVDILINNLGVRNRKAFDQFKADEIVTMIQQNLNAAIYLSQQIIPMMQAQQWGRIISISSIAGRLARKDDSLYPITKMGIEGLVRSLAVQYASDGITSNGIAPGYFMTERNLSMMTTPEEKARHVARVPMQRWGDPEELAGAAVFLASNAASYVNGQVLTIDGGLSASF